MAYPTDPIYKKFKNIDGVVTCIITEKDGLVLSIPISENNRDYQEYVKWLGEGNEPEAAD
jgi:hypothetical protein|tara:strand:+ start:454 stop:633 length:180 start_codon:yes stop_codon:yes gene_type:complete